MDCCETCGNEISPLQKMFGKSNIDTVAAALYASFHGECECTSHPFYECDCGTDPIHMLPWEPMENEYGDVVVEAFRNAALAAYESLKKSGIKSLK